jgi:Fe2+ transport system protein B
LPAGFNFIRPPLSDRISLKGTAFMASMNRDTIVLIRILTSCLTAGLLIFFISSLSGEDLIKNNSTINDLDKILGEITFELQDGINRRVQQLGEVPDINPYRKFYCAEFAKEIHEVAYLTEKQKILFDTYNVRDFETKSKRLVAYSETADIQSLTNELEIVKRELKNSANLIDKRRNKLLRQRTAYIILFFVLWIALYFYYSRGIIRK